MVLLVNPFTDREEKRATSVHACDLLLILALLTNKKST